MQIPIYQVDAFAENVFEGNPAAVCPLDRWLPDHHLQAIASENNLAETAFFIPNGEDFDLRWFTPKFEIDLCGHATLASAHVLFEHLNHPDGTLRFHSKSGLLTVKKNEGLLEMDFPSRPPVEIESNETLEYAIGEKPLFVGKSRDILFEVQSQEMVENLKVNMELVSRLDCVGVIVTAPSNEEGIDFVSRFFAPQAGVPEDPVTGSAHSTLIPYWGEKLGKKVMVARQISPRGGKLWTSWNGDRVSISGMARTYLKGEIFVNE
ncbi:MAG: PhzF family phenazine biosynthesis protein [Bacteroidia bacterium]|nr:PhzF family phenazine biosynthesis protein [Bacteroidia bacterium]